GNAGHLHQLCPPGDAFSILCRKGHIVAAGFACEHGRVAGSAAICADDHIVTVTAADPLDLFRISGELHAIAVPLMSPVGITLDEKGSARLLSEGAEKLN